MAKILLTEDEIKKYIKEVNTVLEKAYVPYSKFPVAALLIDDIDNIHVGVNV